MKQFQIFLSSICVLIYAQVQAQTSASDVFDVMNTTTTPVFIMMGVSHTEIARPTSLKEFTAAVQQSTNGLTELPNTYGLELRLFKDTLVDEESIWGLRNTSISFGYHRENIGEDAEMTRTGIGFHIPILRPKHTINKDTVQQRKSAFAARLRFKSKLEQNVSAYNVRKMAEHGAENDSNPNTLDSDALVQKIKDLNPVEINEARKSVELLDKQIRREKGSVKLRRAGGYVNLFFGAHWDFPASFRYDSTLSKIGGWISAGFERGLGKCDAGAEVKNWISVSTAIRQFWEPHMLYINKDQKMAVQEAQALDIGLKLALTLFKGGVDLSVDAFYRNRTGDDVVLRHTNKYMMNAAYTFKDNFKLSLSLGKDFENHVSQDGNVISIINIIKSLGK